MNNLSVTAKFTDSVISATAKFITSIATVPASDVYDGETTVTPSTSTQTLSTNGKWLASDITVNPIPSNYGLITWDGATLTVS